MFGWLQELIGYFTERSDLIVYYQTTEKCEGCFYSRGVRCRCMQDTIFPNSTLFRAKRHSDKDRTCSTHTYKSDGAPGDGVTLPRVIEPYKPINQMSD